PGTLVDIEETSATALCGGCSVGTSYPTLGDWQSRSRSLVSIGAYEETRKVISGVGEPERVPACLVNAALLPTLGIQPVLGRTLTADDDRTGAAPVMLLSDLLWRRRFGADPRVLGMTLKVDGVAHEIVGVMPPGFRYPAFAQFWMPLTPARHDQKRGDRSLGVVARLK